MRLIKKQPFLFFLILLILNLTIISGNAQKQSRSDLKPNAGDTSQIQAYTVAINSTNNVHVVYNKQIQIYNTLEYIYTGNNYEWNLTASTVVEENSTLNILGKPTMIAASDRLQLAFAFSSSVDSGLIMMEKLYSAKTWTSQIIQKNTGYQYLNPVLIRNSTNGDLWLCWRDNSEDSYKMFYSVYNNTSGVWGNTSRLTEPSGGNSTDCKFILDDSGNAHFVWSEGELNHERILYRVVYWNGTKTPIEFLTDGANRCRYPEIIIDSFKEINIFWSNYTVANPGIVLGTQNIQMIRKAFSGNWSDPLYVAPYLPPERPPGGASDARIPSVTMDLDNNLLLAHEIRELYSYHQGIDIRERSGYSDWQASERICLAINPAIDPFIKCDSNGNLHCFWLDLRNANYELYYRLRLNSNIWTIEIRLTLDRTTFGGYWQLILIVSGVVALVALPAFILDRIRARRQSKIIKKKISDLQE